LNCGEHLRNLRILGTKVKYIIKFLPLLLLTLGSGCATQALWNNGNLEAVKEPASNINLRLFDAKRQNDLLVVYDEYSERNYGIHTRAYWLNENEMRVNQRRAPHFTNTNLMQNLPSVPVFYASAPSETNLTQGRYAIVATNQQSFTLYSGNREISSYDLPFYNDGKGRVEKIALTPIAVTADLTIIGGYIGVWGLYGLAESGYSTH
jgi:hypothetical protein